MPRGGTTINFGPVTARQATAFVDVPGQSGLSAFSYIEAFAMAQATAHHTADVVRVDRVEYTCEWLSATSFRIHGACVRGHTYGDRTVLWVTQV